ncbi:MAG TPA: TonB family protein, partial [Bryobacteraceae bacterium]
ALERGAELLEAANRYAEAEKYLEAALALRAQMSAERSTDYGLCLLKLAAIERKTGKTEEAARFYGLAVNLLPGRMETAPGLLYLGISALAAKKFADSADYLQRAQALDRSLEGPVLMWTGVLRDRQDQMDGAEAAFLAAMAVEPPNSMQTFETLTVYAEFLRRHGRDAAADTLHAQAEVIRKSGFIPTPKPVSEPHATPQSNATQRAGGPVSQPIVLSKHDPPYSEEARAVKYSASVLVQIVVGADGLAHNLRVVRPAGFGLDDCALTAIATWKFKPGEREGTPVPVHAMVEVNFRLL